jgi:hypothetical protein
MVGSRNRGLRVAGCELRVAGYGGRVAGCGVRVSRYGLRDAGVRDTGCQLRSSLENQVSSIEHRETSI